MRKQKLMMYGLKVSLVTCFSFENYTLQRRAKFQRSVTMTMLKAKGIAYACM